MYKVFNALLFNLLFLLSSFSFAQQIKDIASITGLRPNQIIGYGIVVGLDGTGDTVRQVPFTAQALSSMLSYFGTIPGDTANWYPRNIASVIVTADLPALAKPGQLMDVTVSSLGNARSLKGGTLLLTPLRASDGKVYGQAQGGVVIPGSVAAGIYSTVRTNHQNAGRIPNGAIIEASSPSIEFGESIDINLNVADFTVTQKVVESINNELGESAALPLNHRTIRLSIPSDPYERTEFLSKVMDLPAPKVEPSARVVINARTGSVVMNKSVRLEPCAVTHGNITVRIGEINTVSQSPAFSYSRPRIQRNTAASANERPMPLISLEEGPNLGAVVKALNTLGATPQDLLAILQALKAVGSLKADLEVI